MMNRLGPFVARLRPLASKGSWTLLDQALFAGSNFALNVLLARWLTADAYGAFTVAFTVMLLLGTVHTGLFSEPMLVYGASRYRRRLAGYLTALSAGHGAFALAAGLLVAASAAVLHLADSLALAAPLFALAAAQAGILLLWLLRQACYVPIQPRWAVAGGAVYAVLMFGGLAALALSGGISAASAFALMAVASVGACLALAFRLGLRPSLRPRRAFVLKVFRDHGRYGRWAAPTGLLEWIPSYLAYLVLPLWAGLEATGTLKALLNFTLPAVHVYGALCMPLVPLLVRANDEGRFGLYVGGALGLFGGSTLLYGLALGLGGPWLIDVVYGGRYAADAGMLWLVALIPLLASLAAVLRTALRALEQPRLVFWTYLASAAVALTAGMVLIYRFGIIGAVLGWCLQMALESLLMAFLLAGRRLGLERNPRPAPSAGIAAETSR